MGGNNYSVPTGYLHMNLRSNTDGSSSCSSMTGGSRSSSESDKLTGTSQVDGSTASSQPIPIPQMGKGMRRTNKFFLSQADLHVGLSPDHPAFEEVMAKRLGIDQTWKHGELVMTQQKDEQEEEKEEEKQQLKGQVPHLCQLDNYSIKCAIGKGMFGQVFLVQSKQNEKFYAMKVVGKKRLIDQRAASSDLRHHLYEHRIMKKLGHSPFIATFIAAFQTKQKLFLVTEYCPGGDLFTLINTSDDLFSEEEARFYLVELILALEYLHKRQIIYRDLKPENVVLDEQGHCKLIDFGLSRPDVAPEAKMKMTRCGTELYMAPEVYFREEYSSACDWWSLGVIAFDLLTGHLPISEEQDYYQVQRGLIYPDDVSKPAQNLLTGLVRYDQEERLGSEELKKHDFFIGIDWVVAGKCGLKPPFSRLVDGPVDTRHFEGGLTGLEANISRRSALDLSPCSDANFQGFSWGYRDENGQYQHEWSQ